MISVLVINLNNIELTKNCINDLMSQDINFDLTIVDQNSEEFGTDEYLEWLKLNYDNPIINLNIVKNSYNRNINSIWNEFVESSENEFICILNNDVRFFPNFLSSAVSLFSNDKVGAVNHATNCLDYKLMSYDLKYEVIEFPYRQGWDIIFRKSCWEKIPEELGFFYGDDWVYSKLYLSGMKGAYILNSPMIHFCQATSSKKGGNRVITSDKENFKKMQVYKNLNYVSKFSKFRPRFDIIEFCNSIDLSKKIEK